MIESQKEQIKENEENIEKKLRYSIQEKEKNIKFYLINDDIYYIFIKNKNEIQIFSSTELSCSFTLYHHDLIKDFIVTPKTNSLILCTSTDISLYILPSGNKINDPKINYNLNKKISVDNTIHLSCSILEDIIISINNHYIIKIFDLKLNNIKSFNFDKSLIPKDIDLLPLDLFMLNYDTKTILLSKYGYNQFFLIYKQIDNDNNDVIEYKTKNILINENIVCIKEYQKYLDIYFKYKDSSVLLILTEELNFLIVQRVFEENYVKNDDNIINNYIPNIRTLLYIDLNSYSKIKNYYNLSFSFLLNNKNIYSRINEYNFKNTKSDIINMESFNNEHYEDNIDFLNYGNECLKDINYDYIMFNFSEKIYIYKIEGLKLSNYNNPSLVEHYSTVVDQNYKNTFTLLNAIRSFDNNYSIFFIDKFNNIQKYLLKVINNMSNKNNIQNSPNIKSFNYKKIDNIKIDLKKNFKNNKNNIIINTKTEINNNQFAKSQNQLIEIKKNNNKSKDIKVKVQSTSANEKKKSSKKISDILGSESIDFDNKKKYEKEKIVFIEYISMLPLHKNIIYAEYNNFNQLTFIYQNIDSNSVISLLDNNFSVKKIIIFENIQIYNIIWIKNTNFIMFYYTKKNPQNQKDMPILVIFNIFSKILNKKENFVNDYKIKNLLIYVNMNVHFKLNIKINKILIESNLESLKIENADKNKFMINNNANSNNIKNDNKNPNQNITKNPTSIPQINNIDNSFSFYIILKTDFSLYNLTIKIIKTNNAKEYDCEIKDNFVIKQKSLLLTKYDINNWHKKEFIFNPNEIFYTSFNEKYDFIKIIKVHKNSVNKIIFESILLDKISNIHCYNNNFIIYINRIYINVYDIKNRSFYRILNEFNVSENKILFFSYNFHLYLIILSSKNIQLINLVSSKENVNDKIIKYEFKYNFQFGEFNMINLFNNFLFVNESQIIPNLNEIIINKDYNNSIQLMNIFSLNTCSIFDRRTFLDNYLNDDENLNKIIFNILFNRYNKSKTEKTLNYSFKNIKIIPNIFENIDIIKKIISEGKNINDNNTKNNLINIKFKNDIDSSKLVDFQKFFNKNNDLSFINYLYDIISNEKTKKYDNITKYFLLKYKPILNNNNFKLSTSDLCWLSILNNQTDILNFIFQGKNSNITWDNMCKYNIPLWIKNESKLKELLVEVAKNKYKEDFLNKYKKNSNKTEVNNYTENIALYLYLSGNNNLLYNYYDKEPQNEKIKKFIMRDFSIKKNRKAAHENADTLFNKKKYIYAAFFYLLADDVRSALDMVYEKMNDINLTICILKLVHKNKENDYLKYYNLNKIYSELFIQFGILFRDPYLVTFGYIAQEKYDLALEYILNYNYEYNLNQIKETIPNIDDFVSHLDLLKKTLSFRVFDYKMILFAKKLEKIYNIKYEESNKNVKNLVNTDFNEDEWDMDALNNQEEDDEDNKINNVNNNNKNINQEEYKMKKINIDYSNLALLCLKISSIIGNIFTSNINIFSKLNNKGVKNIPNLIKINLKNIIKARIILDSMYITSSFNINKNYKNSALELNKFVDYLFQQGIIINKFELYYKINDTCLLFNLYKNCNILPNNIYNNRQKLNIIKSIENYFESLINEIIYDLLPFNRFQIFNLIKIEDILFKYNHIFPYLVKIIKDMKNINYIHNIYLLRIIFSNFCFLIYICKIFLKYNKISNLFEIMQKLNDEYNDITQIKIEKVIQLIELVNNNIIKLIKTIKKIKLKEIKINLENPLIFYIYFLNYSINKELLQFLQNQKIKKISFTNMIKLSNSQDINYNTIENYTFIKDIQQKLKSNLNALYFYINKYVRQHLNCHISYAIYEELKNVYINKKNINYINDDKNNYKTIKIEKIFPTKDRYKFYDKFLKFEKIFKLGDIIINKLSILTVNFKYEKNRDNTDNRVNTINNQQMINIADTSLPPSNISSKSIQIINNIFKEGYELCNFNNDLKLKDFCLNNCDITQMSLSLLEKGNIKINILDNFIKKIKNKKQEKIYDSIDNWKKAYEETLYSDYKSSFEVKLKQHNYNNIFSILYQNIIIPKYTHKYNNISLFFPKKEYGPPKYFNDMPSKKYLEEISLYYRSDKTKPIYSDILESHPRLPLYLNSNNTGVIFLYSFSGKTKILDEFYIDKIDNNIDHFINKIKFNLYGDNFMACDLEGNLYNWNFEHMQSRKIPESIIHSNSDNQNYFFCNDMCYLNNTGMIATTNNKNIALFDLLMPEKKRKINDIFPGGDLILPFFSENSFIISNNDSPGNISFVDLRKIEIEKKVQLYNINKDLNKQKNNNIQIMDMKLSANEKYLITYGSDYSVKIWDLNDKYNPLLIESLQPFNIENKVIDNLNENFNGKLKLSSGYLFVSKDNNIKLLRNNII